MSQSANAATGQANQQQGKQGAKPQAQQASQQQGNPQDGRDAPASREDAPDDRPTREQESRAAETIHEEWDDIDFAAPQVLDAPEPLPEMDQRWVRTRKGNEDDATNVSRAWRQGWRPRPVDTVPKGFMAPTIKHGSFGNVIGVQGMVLMHRPKRISAQFAARVRDKTDAQMTGVSAELDRSYDPRDKVIGRPEITHKQSIETGRRPVVADED